MKAYKECIKLMSEKVCERRRRAAPLIRRPFLVINILNRGPFLPPPPPTPVNGGSKSDICSASSEEWPSSEISLEEALGVTIPGRMYDQVISRLVYVRVNKQSS